MSRNSFIVAFIFFGLGFFQFHLGWAASITTIDGKIERPIVLVITSYNNKRWYRRNLDAAFSQNYSNYRVVYVDDCSPDGTGDLVERYVKERDQTHRVTLVKNGSRQLKAANFYNAVHTYCEDNEIVCDYDGDDWLAHANVLNVVNEAYANPNVWMTYGNYVSCPNRHKSVCRAIPENIINNNAYRNYTWITSHLRTFYAWLFKKMRRDDFMYGGKFLEMTADLAFMFPMLEMAGGRVKFIPEVLYTYNLLNPISDFRKNSALQIRMDKAIRNKAKYSKLSASSI